MSDASDMLYVGSVTAHDDCRKARNMLSNKTRAVQRFSETSFAARTPRTSLYDGILGKNSSIAPLFTHDRGGGL